MRISIVIPTHNRLGSLRRSLSSIAGQSLPAEHYEVIVVDDGSTPPVTLADLAPFVCGVVRQPNQGASAARNVGAAISRGDVLVFVDDDVCIGPRALEVLAEPAHTAGDVIVLGSLSVPEAAAGSIFARAMTPLPAAASPAGADVGFTECQTGLMALRRDAFAALGGFEDPGGGWPNWDDVDFGYRAARRGFRFMRLDGVTGEHWDHVLTDLRTASSRWRRAARSAASLFRKHPALQSQLPMFRDMLPLSRDDSPRLLLRKLARRAMSNALVFAALTRTVALLERRLASPALLRPLYRWAIGAHIYAGFRSGVNEQRRDAPMTAQVDGDAEVTSAPP